MTSQHLLLLILLTSVMTAVGAVRRKDLGWSIVNGVFAIASAAGYLLAPERAGLWLVVPYIVLAVLPLVGYMLINRMIAAQHYRAASVLSRITLVLHPSTNTRRLVRLIDANQRAAAGDVDEAAEILRETGHEDHVQLELLRLQNRWDEIVVHFESMTTPLEHGSAALYIRALGETGQLDRLAEVYRDAAARWSKRDDMSEELASARLFVAAFLGQPALVEQLYAGPLRKFSPSIKLVWRAIALDAAGDRERATAI